MRLAVNSHALPVYKKNRIASLLCIFETAIIAGICYCQVHLMSCHVVVPWHQNIVCRLVLFFLMLLVKQVRVE